MKEFITPITDRKICDNKFLHIWNYAPKGRDLPHQGVEFIDSITGESIKSYQVVAKPWTQNRMKSWATKEPWTVQWLRETLKPEHVFWDIGACVGVYTIVASNIIGCKKVFAFEPVPQNFCELTNHISINECENVEAYHVAITDQVGYFDWTFSPEAGTGTSSIKRDGAVVAKHFCKIQNFTMDHLVFELGFEQPDIIKIDTDGTESDIIINGGLKTLENVSSIMIEISGEPWERDFHKKLIDMGFELDMEYYEGIRNARQSRITPDMTAMRKKIVELMYNK